MVIVLLMALKTIKWIDVESRPKRKLAQLNEINEMQIKYLSAVIYLTHKSNPALCLAALHFERR